MITSDTIGLALRNLRQARLRTALTTAGVAIGIASLAGMVSFGVGLEDQLVGRFMKSGLFDTITVTPAQDLPGGLARLGGAGRRGGGPARVGGHGISAPPAPPIPLNDEALKKIAALPQVREVYPVVRVPVRVKHEQAEQVAVISGVAMSARTEGVFQTWAGGTFFTRDDAGECLLSADFIRRLTEAEPATLVGQTITISYAGRIEGGATGTAGATGTTGTTSAAGAALAGLAAAAGVQQVDESCRVVGVLERDAAAGGLGGAGISGVMLPLPRALAIDAVAVRGSASMIRDPAEARSYNAVTVKTTSAQSTQDVEEKIKALGLNAFSLNDALQGAKRGFLILDIVLSLIGSIALAVSSLGIVNTMVMSILERTREIGVMKAIGGSDADIRKIFLVEASAIGVLGGIAGVVLGWLVGRVVNFGANYYIQQQGGTPGDLFSLPFWLIASAIGFSWVISLLAGSYPAARAAKLDPIKALRHD